MLIPGSPTPPIGESAAPVMGLDPALLSQVAVPNEDGGMDFEPAPAQPGETDPRATDHDANLAEVLPDHVLDMVASRLLEGIEADRQSNEEMFEMFDKGLELLVTRPGVRIDKPFKGAAAVVHPILLEACIRGSANARGEMLPAAGPARCQVIGDVTPQKEELAERKAAWLNYYLTEVDEDYYPDYDQMLLMLWIYGSMFRKVYRDPLRKGQPVSRALSPYDLIVNYGATSLHGAGRVTQIEPNVHRSDVRRLQLKGWYRDIPLQPPMAGAEDRNESRAQEAEGRAPSQNDEDATYDLYHSHCLLDLEGVEHTGADGEPTGLPLPYIVTIEPQSGKVLRIARNWKPDDPDFMPREYFVHYILWPGLGFYGWGMIRLLGMVAEAATIMLRQGLNAFTFASFPGGFRTKGMRPEQSDMPIAPGELRELDTGGQPIGAAVMPLPYKDVPPSFVPLMQEIKDAGQRLASLSDVAVGDGREDALPGTVIALIEKATKLETTIVKRLHVVHRKELRLLADLFGQDQGAKYPYVVNGKSGTAVAADFADNADVVPVSDPNIPTQTQRLVQAQAVYQLAQASPLIDKKEAELDYLRAMGHSDADIARLMPDQQQPQPSDPVTEFAMCLKGLPLAAGPQQNQQAHITAHMAQLATPGLNKTPNYAALLAHIGDHIGLFYAGEASRLTGIPMQPGQIPPQLEPQVAMAVAAASEQLRQSLMTLAPPADPGAKPGMDPAEVQLKMAELAQSERDSQRKDATEQRQDAIDVYRAHQEALSASADRQTRLQEAQLDLERERVRARADVTQAGLDAASDMHAAALDHHASIATAKIDAEATKAAARKKAQTNAAR